MSRPADPEPPLPVTVLTGFLGAGKTTLLNRLVRDPRLSDAVVLINEFGEIGLDHLLVEAVAGDMILLSSGCLCCSVRGELVSTLETLLDRRDQGQVSPFRRVLIETTGLADPAPVLASVVNHPWLSTRYAVEGVVTVVDAVNGEDTLDTYAEAVKQVAVADRLVLTKRGLATPQAAASLVRRLTRLNPGAPILDAETGEATAAALMDSGPFDPATGKIGDVAGWLRDEAFRDAAAHAGHDHGTGPDQDPHDVNRHDDHVRAFSFATDTPISLAALDLFLTLLPSAHGPKLLRLKGLVRTREDPDHPVVLHGVQHVMHPPMVLPRWPSDDHRTRLVFITRDLEESFVRRMWDAFTGTPAVDTPDRAALMENPLALPKGNA